MFTFLNFFIPKVSFPLLFCTFFSTWNHIRNVIRIFTLFYDSSALSMTLQWLKIYLITIDNWYWCAVLCYQLWISPSTEAKGEKNLERNSHLQWKCLLCTSELFTYRRERENNYLFLRSVVDEGAARQKKSADLFCMEIVASNDINFALFSCAV